jgi:hypothetical protein
MILMGVFFVLSHSMVQGLGDIKEGACLTFQELQAAVETERRDIYQGGDCDIDYGLDGKLTQDLACGLHLETGQWHRSMAQHLKPGFFWFGTPPCQKSVEFLSYDHTTYGEVADGLACTKENSAVLKYQQEKLEAKKFKVGQGAAYLPNPLWVHRENFGFDDTGTYQRLNCSELELVASYLGSGKFHARWVERECGGGKITACREAKLSASENDVGQPCGKVEKLIECKD